MRQRDDHPCDVVLVSMPWDGLLWPSLQIGTLHAVLEREGIRVASREYKFDFLDHCIAATADGPEEERLTAEDYSPIATSCEVGLGDWVFTVPPFLPPDEARDEEYFALLKREGTPDEVASAARGFRTHVASFVAECVEDLVATGARVVGFSSTFSQNVPSLLVARLLKERAPEVLVVLGGSNCEAAMGAALHRAFPWVDVVIRGEGERVFPRVLRELLAGRPAPALPGVCRRVGGESVAEPEERETVSMAEVPEPRFDEYFASLEASLARATVSTDVRLTYESSRGCWWGEKSHCTFCGLNGSTMAYRSKEPDRVAEEIERLAHRYKRLDFAVVDNILDMKYIQALFPRLREMGYDLTLFYETKSNLRRDQVKALSEAGVQYIQPGIESLSTPILKRMRKGVTALQNVRLLKWAAEYGVGVLWNIITGFPGEPEAEYARMSDLLPSLSHLDAPASGALRIDRFSPYHKDPLGHGIELLGPRAHFKYIYDVAPGDLSDLAYRFEYRHLDGRVPSSYAAPLHAAVREWRENGAPRTLVWRRGPGFIMVRDRRHGLPANDFYLEEDAGIAFAACNDGATRGAVAEAILAAGRPARSANEIDELLGQLVALRLAIEEDGRFLTLAIPARPRDPGVAAADATASRVEIASGRRPRSLPLAG